MKCLIPHQTEGTCRDLYRYQRGRAGQSSVVTGAGILCTTYRSRFYLWLLVSQPHRRSSTMTRFLHLPLILKRDVRDGPLFCSVATNDPDCYCRDEWQTIQKILFPRFARSTHSMQHSRHDSATTHRREMAITTAGTFRLRETLATACCNFAPRQPWPMAGGRWSAALFLSSAAQRSHYGTDSLRHFATICSSRSPTIPCPPSTDTMR